MNPSSSCVEGHAPISTPLPASTTSTQSPHRNEKSPLIAGMDGFANSSNVPAAAGTGRSYGGISASEISSHEGSLGTSRRQGKCRGRFSPSSVAVLEEWLQANHKFPYATQRHQNELKAKSGLKRSQILNWIANARKRGRVQPNSMSQQSPSVMSFSQSVSRLRHLHPFERWLYSGPETECAALSDILKAVSSAQSTVEPRAQQEAPPTVYQQHRANWLYFHDCSSMASSMEVRSYAANIQSVCSDEWKDPFDSPTENLLRRRHRAPSSKSGMHLPSTNSNDEKRIFQCTFCTARFKKKHDWERHEKSRHLPRETWICCSQGSVHVNVTTNEVSCVFCEHMDPDSAHIQAHGFTQCVARPVHERTFVRKDHLRQHLRLLHGGCSFHPSMEVWKNENSEISSRCGFCSKTFSTWKSRVSHIAHHFRQGALMSDWSGDWGFESTVLKSLENSTLPAPRALDKAPDVNQVIVEGSKDAAATESPEIDWDCYFETFDDTNPMGNHPGADVNELAWLGLEFDEIKNDQLQGLISDCTGSDWLVDDRQSETVTISSGEHSSDLGGYITLHPVDWDSYLDQDLLDSEPSTVPASDHISVCTARLPTALQDSITSQYD